MNFRDKDKSFDENTPNNLNLKKNEFVYFPPFYESKNKNWSILVGFVQNRKLLRNRQTMANKFYRKKTDKFFFNIDSSPQQ